ncbi:mandelate racemase/muconate lactonizing enzyme family protein [Sporosalibacterium faouarense]|uniref:mandelate racemase/muconate lactonizing enzyme family protein n=1 Tax=Sporosalibacterium faouarense TaxID=516123 RepID=UPI00141C8D60|nr:dipeptide epimerase [Sporosalibacterium faouarense]MTI47161.1 dipeptide epimerase [Bacillota bacterium]
MIIKEIVAKKIKLELTNPISIAIGSIDYCETVIVKIETDEGLIGYGEGAGITFVTGETIDTVINAVEILKNKLKGLNPFSIEYIHKIMDKTLVNNTSAKAAIDIALYDIMSKYTKMPLYRLLGGIANKIETDMTIGISTPEEMAKEALQIVKRGFRYIKIKAGLNSNDDIEAIRQIRQAVGKSIHLKVDANQGWSVGDSIRVIRRFDEYGVDAVEQPIPYWDIDGLAYIRSKSPLKIMADESCFSPQDALKLVKKDAVDIINIKLMKCGGIYKALQINTIAEASGVQCMLGCMMESRIGISAGIALVTSRQNFVYGDLDSFMYFKEDDIFRGGFTYKGPDITLSDDYGLGIEIDF